MPATSKAQQKAAGAALSAKRGETRKSELQGASKSMYNSMSEKQLEEFAETKRKGLPEKNRQTETLNRVDKQSPWPKPRASSVQAKPETPDVTSSASPCSG